MDGDAKSAGRWNRRNGETMKYRLVELNMLNVHLLQVYLYSLTECVPLSYFYLLISLMASAAMV